MTYAYDIAVITRVPDPATQGGGNLYHMPPVYYETEEARWDGDTYVQAKVANLWDYLQDERGINLWDCLPMGPLFELGQIYFLDSEYERCLATGLKPSKWDVDYEIVKSLDEAIALSRKVRGYEEAEVQQV